MKLNRQKRKKARAIKRKSQHIAIIKGIQYKKSFIRPMASLLGLHEVNYVLREIHEMARVAEFRAHLSVNAKALRTGYYLPTMPRTQGAAYKSMSRMPSAQPVHIEIP
ncbi:hypothetical protein Tco_0511453 [Tanacetum coccineum]